MTTIKCPECGCKLEDPRTWFKLGASVAGTIRCPKCGAVFSIGDSMDATRRSWWKFWKVGFLDKLFVDKERKIEKRARRSLGGEDEQIARKLLSLIRQADAEYEYGTNNEAYEKTIAEVKEIGKYLCVNGGDDRMLRIAYRVQALGESVRDLERYWGEEHICGWMD